MRFAGHFEYDDTGSTRFSPPHLAPIPTLQTMLLPLSLIGPLADFAHDQRSISQISATTYFKETVILGMANRRGVRALQSGHIV